MSRFGIAVIKTIAIVVSVLFLPGAIVSGELIPWAIVSICVGIIVML